MSLEQNCDITPADQNNAKVQAYKVPTHRTLAWRFGLELVSIAVVGLLVLIPYAFHGSSMAKIQKRGFFCDDANIKHPYLEETISIKACIGIWIAICLVVVPLVEILHFTVYKYPEWEEVVEEHMGVGMLTCFGRLPRVVFELYRIIGYFFIGALFCLYTTEIAKHQIGRLRPYFLTVCNLPLSEALCFDEDGYNKFVMPEYQHACNSTEYNAIVNAPDHDDVLGELGLNDWPCCHVQDEHVKEGKDHEHTLDEARKSFMSGHSSFSFYCATFLVIYLHVRLSNSNVKNTEIVKEGTIVCRTLLRGIKVLRPFIQFIVYAMAFFIALSRISDYRHHPYDVVTGTIFGNLFAIFILFFHVDIFRRTRSFRTRSLQDNM